VPSRNRGLTINMTDAGFTKSRAKHYHKYDCWQKCTQPSTSKSIQTTRENFREGQNDYWGPNVCDHCMCIGLPDRNLISVSVCINPFFCAPAWNEAAQARAFDCLPKDSATRHADSGNAAICCC